MDNRGRGEALRTLVRRLVQGLQPTRLILFGSSAYGEADTDSDLDLMIIVPESAEPPHRRAQNAYAHAGVVGVPKDLMVLTEEEFERQAVVISSLAHTVKKSGRIVYERAEAPRDRQLAVQEP